MSFVLSLSSNLNAVLNAFIFHPCVWTEHYKTKQKPNKKLAMHSINKGWSIKKRHNRILIIYLFQFETDS